MESKYNIENFEKFLREKTDEFRMYPSKRVWYSIYNNMHPGNRLPSISMCIVLICSLLLVGYLNTDIRKELAINANKAQANSLVASFNRSINKQSGEKNAVYLANQQSTIYASTSGNTINNSTKLSAGRSGNRNSVSVSLSGVQSNSLTVTEDQMPVSNSSRTRVNSNTSNVIPENSVVADRNTITGSTEPIAAAINSNSINFNTSNNSVQIVATGNDRNNVTVPAENITTVENNTTIVFANNTASIKVSTGSNQVSTEDAADSKPGKINSDHPASTNATATPSEKDIATGNKQDIAKTTSNKANLMSVADKMWIDNFAMYNRPVPKKWAGKVSWQAYVTPSVVYRKLYNNTANKSLSGNGNGNFNNADVDNVVIQKPSFGVETGLSLQYDLFKILKVKAGVQLNYTRYNAHAFENQHPIATSLTMNSDDNNTPYEVFRSTAYSNMYGLNPVKLHNETYQFSLPIGADLKLFSSNNISWYAGTTIQPTLVIYGRSYLISSDRRNYIKDPTMLNRFNLNAGFETYLSFKTSGYTWQVGPQFRSQIFSTNSNIYSVEERLMNYGFKIGITKKL